MLRLDGPADELLLICPLLILYPVSYFPLLFAPERTAHKVGEGEEGEGAD